MASTEIRFLEAAWPSANACVLTSDPPVLVDTGYHTEVRRLEAQLAGVGVDLSGIGLIINTHTHSDHIGGNREVQARSRAPILMHEYEGGPINRGDWWATGLRYLDQEAPPFRVAQYLRDGERLRFGDLDLDVLHVPGHSAGSIALYAPEPETLILGDLFHADDVGWINPRLEGAIAVYNARASLERIRGLRVRRAYSGHGPAIEDVPGRLAAALDRIEGFIADPRRMATHAMKRIFVFALMIRGGLPEREVSDCLRGTLWFPEFCTQHFPGEAPDEVAGRLLADLGASGAIAVRGGRVVSTALAPPQDRGGSSA